MPDEEFERVHDAHILHQIQFTGIYVPIESKLSNLVNKFIPRHQTPRGRWSRTGFQPADPPLVHLEWQRKVIQWLISEYGLEQVVEYSLLGVHSHSINGTPEATLKEMLTNNRNLMSIHIYVDPQMETNSIWKRGLPIWEYSSLPAHFRTVIW